MARIPKLFTTFTGKTAYDLLEQIKKIVLKEPKAMQMCQWNVPLDLVPANRRPACGTIGCIGGWINHLTHTDQSCEAARVLGFDPVTASRHDDPVGQLCFHNKLISDPSQGTLRHARKVVSHINRFQRKYRDHLKATPVVVAEAN